MAALQTELRLMNSLATAPLSINTSLLQPTAVIGRARDARMQLDPSRLEQVLEHFEADVEGGAAGPRMLIVVAHQDDETIGAGTQLARMEDVTVLHVTDGAPRDPAYAQRFGYATASEYGEARRREAAEALMLAGVPAERQLCFGIPDGEASCHMVDLSLRMAELMEDLQPEVVLTHPYEGGHTDHDAIAFAVHLACGILRREGILPPTVLELTSYHNANGIRVVHDFLPHEVPLPTRTLRLSKRARDLKARMYDCFRTQRKCLSQFQVDVERFRPAPRYIFTRPPHEGQLDYERLTERLSYGDWRAQAERALAELRTDLRSTVRVLHPEPALSSAALAVCGSLTSDGGTDATNDQVAAVAGGEAASAEACVAPAGEELAADVVPPDVLAAELLSDENTSDPCLLAEAVAV